MKRKNQKLITAIKFSTISIIFLRLLIIPDIVFAFNECSLGVVADKKNGGNIIEISIEPESQFEVGEVIYFYSHNSMIASANIRLVFNKYGEIVTEEMPTDKARYIKIGHEVSNCTIENYLKSSGEKKIREENEARKKEEEKQKELRLKSLEQELSKVFLFPEELVNKQIVFDYVHIGDGVERRDNLFLVDVWDYDKRVSSYLKPEGFTFTVNRKLASKLLDSPELSMPRPPAVRILCEMQMFGEYRIAEITEIGFRGRGQFRRGFAWPEDISRVINNK